MTADDWFAGDGGQHYTRNGAWRICQTCPVRAQCLEVGIGEEFGLWGGTTPYQRKRIRRQRRVAA
jgi:WhiB family redox-sensing transcriptional regulator